MTQTRKARTYLSFSTPVIMFCQALSILANVLVAFSIAVWVYQESGSIILYGLVFSLGYIPELLVSPALGTIIDRTSRKYVLLLCFTGQASVYALLAFIISTEQFTLTWAALVIGLGSAFGGCNRLIYNASITLLAKSTKQQQQLNAISQLNLSAAHILAPLFAGILLEHYSLLHIVCLSTLLSSSAVIACLVTQFPALSGKNTPTTEKLSIRKGIAQGYSSICFEPALKSLLLLHAIVNFIRSTIIVLFTPMILSFSSTETLGGLRSLAGVGMLVGALGMICAGNNRFNIQTVNAALFISGISITVLGGTQHIASIGAAVILLFAACSVMATATNSLWQDQIDNIEHGKVFGLRDSVTGTCTVLAYLTMPALTDWLENTYASHQVYSNIFFSLGLLTIVLALRSITHRR